MDFLDLSLNNIELQAKSILSDAGYDAASLILKLNKNPGCPWRYEALAATNSSLRRVLVANGEATTAEEFLALLRKRTSSNVLQLQSA